MRACKCPYCGSELVRVEPLNPKSCDFWCDACCVSMRIDLPSVAISDKDLVSVGSRHVEAGQLYRHFKGTLYRVVGVAEHTESEQSMVVYHAEASPSKLWVRPLSMFLSGVNTEKYPNAKQVYRYELVEE